MSATVITGDCREALRELPDGLARCVVTSPPYWGLRDYGVDGQIGLEDSIGEYIGSLVNVFREVRRVITEDGTLWLNVGDCFVSSPGGAQGLNGHRAGRGFTARIETDKRVGDLQRKNLIGLPWRVAFALQDDGWILRSDIVWHKPNTMPESVEDRPTRAHEFVFLFSKSAHYHYDAAAIAEPASGKTARIVETAGEDLESEEEARAEPYGMARELADKRAGRSRTRSGLNSARVPGIGRCSATRNSRSVWTIATRPFREAHFATFPEGLAERCLLAGSARGDTVLDPFAGAGTTGLAALRHGRSFIGIELNPRYAQIARRRCERVQVTLPLERIQELST